MILKTKLSHFFNFFKSDDRIKKIEQNFSKDQNVLKILMEKHVSFVSDSIPSTPNHQNIHKKVKVSQKKPKIKSSNSFSYNPNYSVSFSSAYKCYLNASKIKMKNISNAQNKSCEWESRAKKADLSIHVARIQKFQDHHSLETIIQQRNDLYSHGASPINDKRLPKEELIKAKPRLYYCVYP